jgi:hypothetical protein
MKLQARLSEHSHVYFLVLQLFSNLVGLPPNAVSIEC